MPHNPETVGPPDAQTPDPHTAIPTLPLTPSLPILGLHGWLGRGADWAAVADALGRPILAPDLPGHGTATGNAPSSMDGAADFALHALDDAAAGRAIVAGYSMGGRVALHLALRNPERVAGLVLVSASAGLATEGERRARRTEDAGRARRLLEDPEAFLREWYDGPLFNPLSAAARAALVADRLRHGAPDGWARAQVGLSLGAQPWHGNRIHEIRAPAAVLAGAVDAKFTRLAYEIAAAGDFAATIVPGAGHALLVERPDTVALAVARVLSDSATERLSG